MTSVSSSGPSSRQRLLILFTSVPQARISASSLPFLLQTAVSFLPEGGAKNWKKHIQNFPAFLSFVLKFQVSVKGNLYIYIFFSWRKTALDEYTIPFSKQPSLQLFLILLVSGLFFFFLKPQDTGQNSLEKTLSHMALHCQMNLTVSTLAHSKKLIGL